MNSKAQFLNISREKLCSFILVFFQIFFFISFLFLYHLCFDSDCLADCNVTTSPLLNAMVDFQSKIQETINSLHQLQFKTDNPQGISEVISTMSNHYDYLARRRLFLVNIIHNVKAIGGCNSSEILVLDRENLVLLKSLKLEIDHLREVLKVATGK